MKFNENDSTNVKRVKNIVYFLLNEEEVVYVGQSKTGLDRPFSHRDKIFDHVSYIECTEYDLNRIESEFIRKYNPKYNIRPGLYNYSFAKARNTIRDIFGYSDFSLYDLKRIMKHLAIQSYMQNGCLYISQDDVCEIVDFIKKSNLTINQIKTLPIK